MPKKIPAGRPGIPNPIDIYVGQRLKQKRTLLGLSQTKMADKLGITFQQVQKYEKGTNRMSASRLIDLASVLDVPITYFFDDMPDTVSKQSPRLWANKLIDSVPEMDNPMVKSETLTLVRAYYEIKDRTKRKSIINLCKVMKDEKN